MKKPTLDSVIKTLTQIKSSVSSFVTLLISLILLTVLVFTIKAHPLIGSLWTVVGILFFVFLYGLVIKLSKEDKFFTPSPLQGYAKIILRGGERDRFIMGGQKPKTPLGMFWLWFAGVRWVGIPGRNKIAEIEISKHAIITAQGKEGVDTNSVKTTTEKTTLIPTKFGQALIANDVENKGALFFFFLTNNLFEIQTEDDLQKFMSVSPVGTGAMDQVMAMLLAKINEYARSKTAEEIEQDHTDGKRTEFVKKMMEINTIIKEQFGLTLILTNVLEWGFNHKGEAIKISQKKALATLAGEADLEELKYKLRKAQAAKDITDALKNAYGADAAAEIILHNELGTEAYLAYKETQALRETKLTTYVKDGQAAVQVK